MSDAGIFGSDPIAGFSRFYRELHGDDELKRERGPYFWQLRLAEQLTEGRLARALQAPTGAGKTTLIEAFLFALARQLHHKGERTLPLRLFWVVDRRSVVDQVHRHASLVTNRIEEADETAPALAQVKRALESAGGGPGAENRDGLPSVECQCWRGGTGLRPTTLRPDVAAIVCSTVDQVGSRLLFRGYGTSRAARPIDAALVGTDSLVVVDEAHIAQPFVETAKAVATAQMNVDDPGRPLETMRMSATLAPEGDGEGEVFRLTEEELAEPGLARRLDAAKRVRLAPPARTRVSGMVAAARELARGPGLVGVVANTVGEARQIHTELARDHEAWLLIGPNRPILRDALIDAIPARGERAEGVGPKLIVATQTIEVGVDLDFDAMVSACAPLDALAQRLGRLDRAGAAGETEAVVVHSKEPCPVYGEATARTWALLEEWADHGVVEMGPRRIDGLLSSLSPSRRAEVTSPVQRAPLLTPWQIEALAQTSEDPVPSPEVALFLHGDETLPAAEVNVVWRQDLTGAGAGDEWEERVLARPPHPEEAISLPIGKVKAWLRRSAGTAGRDPDPVADVELGSTVAETRVRRGGEPAQFVLVTPGPRASRIDVRRCQDPNEIAPGATVVVPGSYGCCDEFGWIPGAEIDERSHSHPEDLGDLNPAHPRLLFDPGWARRDDMALSTAAAEVTQVLELSLGEAGEAELYRLLREPVLVWLRSVLDGVEPSGPGPREGPRRRRRALLELIEGSEVGTARMVREDESHASGDNAFVLEPDLRESDFQRPRKAVSLAAHSERVAQHARRLASVACRNGAIADAVELAARYHDHGKLDPRFQRWMFLGGDPDPGRALAKSGISPRSHRSEQARRAAGWPRGKRHESLSALLLSRSSLASGSPSDVELATYLIAVHHGRNRPFLPREDPDPDPVDITAEIEGGPVTVSSSETLDWAAHAAVFARLNRRYGPWGLALIEAALVQADWLASQEEQRWPQH